MMRDGKAAARDHRADVPVRSEALEHWHRQEVMPFDHDRHIPEGPETGQSEQDPMAPGWWILPILILAVIGWTVIGWHLFA